MKKGLCLVLSIIMLVCICGFPCTVGAWDYNSWENLESTATKWYCVYSGDSPASRVKIDAEAENHVQGKSSLKIENLSDVKSFDIVSGTGDMITAADIGSSYRIVFWAKGAYCNSSTISFYPKYHFDDNKVVLDLGDRRVWQRFETTLVVDENFLAAGDTGSGSAIAFEIRGQGVIWIDNVSVQKIIGNGIYGPNVLPNPTFERGYEHYNGTDCYDTETVPHWTVFSSRPTYDMDARIVSDVFRSEGHSLRLKNNMGCVQWLYFRLFQSYADRISNGATEVYNYSFWVKSENQTRSDMLFGASIGGGHDSGFNDQVYGSRDWTQITGTWSPTGTWSNEHWGNYDFFITSGSNGTIWIDDVEIKKADGSGSNIVLNPGFEILPDADQQRRDIENASVKPSVNSAKISWKNPEDYRFAGTKVYKVIDGYTSLLTDLPKEAAEYTADSTGRYIITTYGQYSIPNVANDGYLNSPGVTVDVNFVDFSIDKTFIKIDGAENGNLIAGTTKPCISAISKDAKTVTLALALYNGNKLVNCVCENVNVAGGSALEEITTTNSLTIPDISSGNYSAKVFVFDNTNNMKPLLTNVTAIVPPQAN